MDVGTKDEEEEEKKITNTNKMHEYYSNVCCFFFRIAFGGVHSISSLICWFFLYFLTFLLLNLVCVCVHLFDSVE